MRSRNIRLLIMLGVLIVAVAVYVLLVLAGKDDAAEATDDPIRLVDIDNTTVVGLQWQYNGEDISLKKDAGGAWHWTGDENCPVSTPAVESLINTFSSVTASRAVADPSEAAEYGLDTPAYMYTATLVSGHQITLSLGDYSSYAGGYYAAVSANNGVYIVPEDVISGFSVGVMDLLQYETAPDLSGATRLTVTSNRNVYELRYYADSSGMSYSDSYHWFLRQGQRDVAASTAVVEELLGSLSALNWIDCIAYDADAQRLADCGIGQEGSTKVTAVYPGADGSAKTFTLLLGDYVNGACYANIEGSTMLYTITGASADRFILLTADDVRATELCMVDEGKIMSISFELDGTTVQLDYAGEESATDGAGELVSVPVWQRGGIKLNHVEVSAFISALTSLQTDMRTDGEYGRREMLSLCLTLTTGEEIRLAFYTYSSTQVAAARDDATYLVSLTGVEQIIECAHTLMTTEA